LKPTAYTEVGLGFRSSVRESVSGSLDDAGRRAAGQGELNLARDGDVGVRQKITDQWTVLAGAE